MFYKFLGMLSVMEYRIVNMFLVFFKRNKSIIFCNIYLIFFIIYWGEIINNDEGIVFKCKIY